MLHLIASFNFPLQTPTYYSLFRSYEKIMSRLPEQHRDIPLRTRNNFLEFGRELVIDKCIGETLPLFLPFNDESELSDEVTRNAFSKVYTALRKLDEPIVVLCGVIFNREQFRIWNVDADAETNTHEKDNPLFLVLEGKSDFTILGPNYLVLIEVSEMKSDANVQMFKKDISIKMKYQKKSIELIEKIFSGPDKSVSLKLFKTFSFICFPLIEKEIDFLNLSKAGPKEKNSSCITRLELEEIQLWWDTKVKNQISARNDSIGDDSLVTIVLPVLLVMCSVRDETIKGLPEPIEDHLSEEIQSSENTHMSSEHNHETHIVRQKFGKKAENHFSDGLKSKSVKPTHSKQCHFRLQGSEHTKSEIGTFRRTRSERNHFSSTEFGPRTLSACSDFSSIPYKSGFIRRTWSEDSKFSSMRSETGLFRRTRSEDSNFSSTRSETEFGPRTLSACSDFSSIPSISGFIRRTRSEYNSFSSRLSETELSRWTRSEDNCFLSILSGTEFHRRTSSAYSDFSSILFISGPHRRTRSEDSNSSSRRSEAEFIRRARSELSKFLSIRSGTGFPRRTRSEDSNVSSIRSEMGFIRRTQFEHSNFSSTRWETGSFGSIGSFDSTSLGISISDSYSSDGSNLKPLAGPQNLKPEYKHDKNGPLRSLIRGLGVYFKQMRIRWFWN